MANFLILRVICEFDEEIEKKMLVFHLESHCLNSTAHPRPLTAPIPKGPRHAASSGILVDKSILLLSETHLEISTKLL